MMKTNNVFRAELDAYYARLYGLARDELCYTLCGVDPIVCMMASPLPVVAMT